MASCATVHHAQSPRQGSYPAPTTLLLSTETPQTHRRLTTVRRNTIEAHLCIAELVTRAACCLYLPLTATRSEKGPAMASPSSLLGEVAKGAPWQYLHTNMVLGETVDGWCSCRACVAFPLPHNTPQRQSTPLNPRQRLSTPLNAPQHLSTPHNTSQHPSTPLKLVKV